jgi:hypothetical protein
MMVRAFRLFAGTLALAALALQFWLMTKYPGVRSVAVTVLRFFSFFTMQINVLIVVCTLVPALAPMSRASEFLSRPQVRTAVASYSAVVAIIYFVLLRNLGHDYGLERLADRLLHYVTPALFLIDWLVWVRKGQVRLSDLGTYLIYPTLYCAWTFLYGAITRWYPYPFFNAARHGYAQAIADFVGVACVVIAITLLFLVVDRVLAALQRARA